MTLLITVQMWSAVVHFLLYSVRGLLENIDMSLNCLQWSRLRGHFHLTFIKFSYKADEELSRMFEVKLLNKILCLQIKSVW
jgi:hypothetical protein